MKSKTWHTREELQYKRGNNKTKDSSYDRHREEVSLPLFFPTKIFITGGGGVRMAFGHRGRWNQQNIKGPCSCFKHLQQNVFMLLYWYCYLSKGSECLSNTWKNKLTLSIWVDEYFFFFSSCLSVILSCFLLLKNYLKRRSHCISFVLGSLSRIWC